MKILFGMPEQWSSSQRFIMRDTTERPEALESGKVHLVGTNYDKIVNEVSTLLEDAEAYRKMSQAVNLYGDGLACGRISEFLEKV